MKQITLKVDGMMCGMCESHVNEAVRKAFPKAKKVTSSHSKGPPATRCWATKKSPTRKRGCLAG